MQILRSSRGLLVLGGVLAVVAFVLVVVVLNNRSNSAAPAGNPTPLATPVPGTPTATAVPTQAFGLVVARRNVPASTKLSDLSSVYTYFKDVPLGPNVPQPPNAVNSIHDWLNVNTTVFSPTTGLFVGTIQMTNPIRQGKPLLLGDYKVLPISPLGSLAYTIPPGRVAETVQVSNLQADNLQILPGDFVDVLLSIRQHEVDSLQSNPQPSSASSASNWQGPVETQQLISDAEVIATGPAGTVGSQTYTLVVPLQDAVLLKYVKDTFGTIDLVLVSSDDVKNQTVQPRTNAVFPEYFSTPEAIVKGTPQGMPNVFVTPRPTYTPAPASQASTHP